MKYRILLPRKNNREHVRKIARQAWIDSNGNPDYAKELVRDRSLYGSIIATILIGIAIKLAFELIMNWWRNREAIPAMKAKPGDVDY